MKEKREEEKVGEKEKEIEEKIFLDAERRFGGVLSLGDELEGKKMRERERKSEIRKEMLLY